MADHERLAPNEKAIVATEETVIGAALSITLTGLWNVIQTCLGH